MIALGTAQDLSTSRRFSILQSLEAYVWRTPAPPSWAVGDAVLLSTGDYSVVARFRGSHLPRGAPSASGVLEPPADGGERFALSRGAALCLTSASFTGRSQSERRPLPLSTAVYGHRLGPVAQARECSSAELSSLVTATGLRVDPPPSLAPALLAALRGVALVGGSLVAVPWGDAGAVARVISVTTKATTPFPFGPHALVTKATQLTLTYDAPTPPPKLDSTNRWEADPGSLTSEAQEQVVRALSQALSGGDAYGRGVLVTGVPGSGKTCCVRRALSALRRPYVEVRLLDLFFAETGVMEREISSAFDRAARAAPSTVFIDNIGSVRDEHVRILAALLRALDDAHRWAVRGCCVGVVATSMSSQLLPESLLSARRLGREVRLTAFSRARRTALVKHVLQRLNASCSRKEGQSDDDGSAAAAVASVTPGFVASDLSKLLTQAWLAAVREARIVKEPVVKLHPAVFLREAAKVRPALLVSCRWWRAVSDTSEPDGEDVGGARLPGLEASLLLLRSCLALALSGKAPPGIGSPRGALIHGVSGCGKTALALQVARSVGAAANFVSVSASEVVSAVPGETERAVRELFMFARAASPTLLLLESLEILAPSRSQCEDDDRAQRGAQSLFQRVLTTLLIELDGIRSSRSSNEVVFVLATTRHREAVDSALLRPGRIELSVEVTLPDADARHAILRRELHQVTLQAPGAAVDVSDDVMRRTAEKLNKWTPADLRKAVREAHRTAERRAHPVAITADDLLSAVSLIPT